jgi:hypothetical protein
MAEPKRLFTREEATALLPRVEPHVVAMREAAAAARACAPLVAGFAERASASGGAQPAPREQAARRALFTAEARLAGAVEALGELGIWVKDVERGLVDFPSERDGEVVELCWLHGEPAVDHWHRIGEGFAGRRPL